MKNYEKTLDALWCWDSETGKEVLLDMYTKEILAERIDGKIIVQPLFEE